VTRTDAYDWLREKTSPAVLAHLSAERSFYDAVTEHLRPKVRTLSEEMSSRVPATDWSISYRRVRFSYYTLTPSGREYAQLCRGFVSEEPDRSAPHVLLDPVEIIGDSPYFEFGLTLVSPDERLLAYSTDLTGDEVYVLRFRDLDAGADLPDVLARTYYGGAWSADSTTFFYTVHDEAYRPYQVWRHVLGTAADQDELVFADEDERFAVDVRGCRSGDVIVISTQKTGSSEEWVIDAHDPAGPARCVEPRRDGVEYFCEHARTPDGDRLLIVTDDGATEFRLMQAPLASPARESWTEVVAENAKERLISVDAFLDHYVLTLRRDGALMLRAVPLDRMDSGDGSVEITASIPAGTISLDHNELFATTSVNVVEQSYTEPRAWYSVDLGTGARQMLRRHPTPGYEPAEYVSERIQVPAQGPGTDAVMVPVTLARRRDTALDGSAPCLFYGYGAYEACFEPEFDPALPSLLDRGVVYAHAHIRGGGEGGRTWWLDGRMEHKQNTFSDLIAVADHLADGLVDGDRIATRGISAGGLLQGAVFSQRPDRWRAVVAEVPFVDVVTTMLDASIPLTSGEWEEWGDPRRPADFAWMLSYSPYDNIPPAGGRPDLLATGALHDARVMVWEPAKWVAALRETDPDWSANCLFRVETGAGAHAGPTGRYARLRYEAEIFGWLLDRLAVTA
jgi:oligopeptidase B